MNELITTVTKRGQVTVPSKVRRYLGVQPRDKICFRIEDGEVKLTRMAGTLEGAFGAVEPLRRPEDFEERAREAKAERAVQSARKLRPRGLS